MTGFGSLATVVVVSAMASSPFLGARAGGDAKLVVGLSGARNPETSPTGLPRRTGRSSHELWLPLGSVLLPGLGQYAQGAPEAGIPFSLAAIGGYSIRVAAEGDNLPGLPRSSREQAALLGLQIGLGSGFLSAYDSFHRSLPELQESGRYRFLRRHESTSDLLWAPFDFRYLRRSSTIAPLAITVAATALTTALKLDDGPFVPFDPQDGFFALGLAYNAGVTEEAVFRGYVFPVLHENLGRKMWLSNTLQAAIFGLAHYSSNNRVPWFQTLAGMYWGEVTLKNRGSVREAVFQHFWYDAIVLTTAFLTEKKPEPISVNFTIRF